MYIKQVLYNSEQFNYIHLQKKSALFQPFI